MATLTIRNVEEHVHQLLRERAAQNGRSVEAEVRGIIVDYVNAPTRNVLLELNDRLGHAGLEVPVPPRADGPRDVVLP